MRDKTFFKLVAAVFTLWAVAAALILFVVIHFILKVW